jgi:hypothetical protein
MPHREMEFDVISLMRVIADKRDHRLHKPDNRAIERTASDATFSVLVVALYVCLTRRDAVNRWSIVRRSKIGLADLWRAYQGSDIIAIK